MLHFKGFSYPGPFTYITKNNKKMKINDKERPSNNPTIILKTPFLFVYFQIRWTVRKGAEQANKTNIIRIGLNIFRSFGLKGSGIFFPSNIHYE